MKKTQITALLVILATTLWGTYKLPDFNGWEVTTGVDTYYPDNLWEIINGAADAFVSFGFEELNTFEVKSGDLEYAVYIYDMGTPLNAYGMYRSENSPSDSSDEIGTETQFSDYLTVLLKDRYYVKIETIAGETSRPNARSLVEDLARSLSGSTALPPQLSLLPQSGRIAGSERYIRENFLGVKELARCLYARYREGNREYRIFIMFPEEQGKSAEIPPELEKKWTPRSESSTTVYFRTIPYTGPVGLSQAGEFWVGMVDFEDPEELFSRMKILLDTF